MTAFRFGLIVETRSVAFRADGYREAGSFHVHQWQVGILLGQFLERLGDVGPDAVVVPGDDAAVGVEQLQGDRGIVDYEIVAVRAVDEDEIDLAVPRREIEFRRIAQMLGDAFDAGQRVVRRGGEAGARGGLVDVAFVGADDLGGFELLGREVERGDVGFAIQREV